jgi:PAS domain S-box-containing protein
VAPTPAIGTHFEKNDGFRLLFTNNPQPMWVYDLKTLQFLEVNEAAIAHYGYSRDEFLRMRISDIRPADDVARLAEDVANAPAGLQSSGEWKHILRDGRIIDVEVVSHTLEFADRPARLVAVHDITERKRTEEALRQAEQKYRHIFEEAIVGIFQSTPQGRFTSANASMARMLGYDSPEDLIASITDIQQQLYVDAARRDEFKRLLEEQGERKGLQLEVYRKDRSRMWLSMNVRAVREAGMVVRYEGTFEDISERKLLEEQFRQAQKMEAVGRLAGGVAHDFNNALGVITGYSDLLQMRLPPDDQLRKYAQEIAKAGHRAASLTRQLLAFSRKQVIQPVVLDLNAVVNDMGKMLQRLIGEDINIKFSRSGDLASIKADPGQVEQVLMNLAVNARDAMPQGGKVFIETANAELDHSYTRQHAYVKPGRYVSLSFSDTGCGMDKETQAHIFEPFFTTKEAGKGTGLGLSTVYGIVKQNGGYVWVYSEPGKGTTFKIYFPRSDEAQKAADAAETSPAMSSGSETVLLVEDEEPLRQLARTCLETGGYTVLCAPDAKSAIEVARLHPDAIHLLLTDVIMPGLSGHDLAKIMSALRPDIKILYMSGYTNDLIAQYGVLDSETLLLEKPFTLYSLLNKVDLALHGRQTKAARAG